MLEAKTFRSIFTPSTKIEREQNFESYWLFDQEHSGQLFEGEKDLSRKREKLTYFQKNEVRSEIKFKDPEIFYRNYIKLVDDPNTMDRKVLFLTCIYKFARHEWVGISGAWDAVPPLARAKSITDKISRYHLAEEFCHVRFFHEMFKVFHLDRVEWVPLGPFMQRVYGIFPHFPEAWMSPPAFVTELMGLTFYQELDRNLDIVFDDEPRARERVRELLYEIMTDELAHIGQRRNYIGGFGIHVAKWMIRPVFKAFFRDIPEARFFTNVEKMIKNAHEFSYQGLPKGMIERSWVPTYCK